MSLLSLRVERRGEMKPPYRVPTMKQIVKVPWNHMTVASTFSGCGGSSLGYRMAGFKVVYANEFVEAARDTYMANASSDTVLDASDIRDVSGQAVLAAIGLGVGELDVLDGSPPCASFSMAGRRNRHWGEVVKYSETQQRVDDLFFEFARLLNDIQPRAFIAENVSGLIRGRAKGYFKNILSALRATGYKVEARLLNAAHLGVPQSRQRVFFQGIRNDVSGIPSFPKPFPHTYAIEDAIPWIHDETQNPYEVEARSYMGAGSSLKRAWTLIGGFGQYSQVPGVTGQTQYELRRPSPQKPVNTITAMGGNRGMASVAHPYIARKFSIAETKLLCSFPDDFILTGTYEQRYERLGRAVPPLMMKAIATELATTLL